MCVQTHGNINVCTTLGNINVCTNTCKYKIYKMCIQTLLI